jgi:hypothetical protein
MSNITFLTIYFPFIKLLLVISHAAVWFLIGFMISDREFQLLTPLLQKVCIIIIVQQGTTLVHYI